jgi:opacity protein-like surface antigen
MFKHTALALTLLSLSLTASANWQTGAGFANFSDSADGDDLSLNIIYGSVSYKVENSGKDYFFMPEFRIGTGVGDDTLTENWSYQDGYTGNSRVISSDIKFEIERFIALSLRGQYDFSNGAYVYVVPSYANLKAKVSYSGESDSDDSWEFGVGAGVGYQLNKKISVEASYENYDETDLLSVGFKYAF